MLCEGKVNPPDPGLKKIVERTRLVSAEMLPKNVKGTRPTNYFRQLLSLSIGRLVDVQQDTRG